jgi:hypothetical protein
MTVSLKPFAISKRRWTHNKGWDLDRIEIENTARWLFLYFAIVSDRDSDVEGDGRL